jgi:phosphatidate cytidylyltransferase
MLKQRLITALILISLVVWGILSLPLVYIAAVFALIILIGAWEWARLSGFEQFPVRIVYVVLFALTLWQLWEIRDQSRMTSTTAYIALAWWLLALVWLSFPTIGKVNSVVVRVIKLCTGLLVLIPAWLALISIHEIPGQGPYWLLYTLSLIWIADSGAYFSGKTWGRHKLAPKVSPGKTWEGVLGALVLVAVYALVAGIWANFSNGPLFYFILASLLMVPVSIIGDLFESLMKRQAGIKDSGALLPGHGGILDRIDSLTAVLPMFLLILLRTGFA